METDAHSSPGLWTPDFSGFWKQRRESLINGVAAQAAAMPFDPAMVRDFIREGLEAMAEDPKISGEIPIPRHGLVSVRALSALCRERFSFGLALTAIKILGRTMDRELHVSGVAVQAGFKIFQDLRDRLDRYEESAMYALESSGPLQEQPDCPENDLDPKENFYRLLFQCGPQPVLVTDDSGRVLAANSMALAVLGRHGNEISGQPLYSLFEPADSGSIEKILRRLRPGKSRRIRISILGTGMRANAAAVNFRLLDMPGGPYVQVLIQMASRRRALESRLEEERKKAREMEITLKNFLQAARSENEGREPVLAAANPGEGPPRSEPMFPGRYSDAQRIKTAGRGQDQVSARLTPTEQMICRQILEEMTTKEIAEAMHLSFETVQTHRKNIRRKLGLRGRRIALISHLRDQFAY